MSQARAVPNFIDGIKLLFMSLTQNDDVNSNDAQKEADKIAETMQDNAKISKLVDSMEKVNIPLEDEKSVVKKAKVSEEIAQQRADEVKEVKQKDDKTKTRE